MRAKAGMVLLILMTMWAGIVIGVSLIATPIKFQAPSLTMQTGVERMSVFPLKKERLETYG